MRKIIITEDDKGVVEVKQYYKGPFAFSEWELLETEGKIVEFTRLLHRVNRKIKTKNEKAKKEKKTK